MCAWLEFLFAVFVLYMSLSSLTVLLGLNECHCKALVYLRLFISVTVFAHGVCYLPFKAYRKADFVTFFYLVCLGSHC